MTVQSEAVLTMIRDLCERVDLCETVRSEMTIAPPSSPASATTSDGLDITQDDGTAADFRDVVLDMLECQVNQMDGESYSLLVNWMQSCSLSCVQTVFDQLQRQSGFEWRDEKALRAASGSLCSRDVIIGDVSVGCVKLTKCSTPPSQFINKSLTLRGRETDEDWPCVREMDLLPCVDRSEDSGD
eukprot:gene11804-15021_t